MYPAAELFVKHPRIIILYFVSDDISHDSIRVIAFNLCVYREKLPTRGDVIDYTAK